MPRSKYLYIIKSSQKSIPQSPALQIDHFEIITFGLKCSTAVRLNFMLFPPSPPSHQTQPIHFGGKEEFFQHLKPHPYLSSQLSLAYHNLNCIFPQKFRFLTCHPASHLLVFKTYILNRLSFYLFHTYF